MSEENKETERIVNEMFKEFDKNNDGMIDREEFTHVCTGAGIDSKEIEEVFKKIDTNSDGNISAKELFVNYMNEKKEKEDEIKRLTKLFKEMDTDNSGFIDLNEFRKVMADEGIDGEDANEIFQVVDTNRDGKINLEEFLNSLDEPDK